MNSKQSKLSEAAAAVISQLDEATSRCKQVCSEAKQQYHAACLQARREEKAAAEGQAKKLAALAEKSENFGQNPFPVVVPPGDWFVTVGFDGRATLKPRPAGRKPRLCNSEKMIEGRAVEGRGGYEYQVCPGEWTAIVNTGGRALFNPKRGPKLSQGVNRLRLFLAFCLSMVGSAASRPDDRPKGSATPSADSPPDRETPLVDVQLAKVSAEEHARLPERLVDQFGGAELSGRPEGPVESSPPENVPAPAESQKEQNPASSFVPQEIKSRAHSEKKIFTTKRLRRCKQPAPAPKKKAAALPAPLGFIIQEPNFSDPGESSTEISPAESRKPASSKSSAGKSSPKSAAKPRAVTSPKTSAGQSSPKPNPPQSRIRADPSPKSKVSSERASPKAEASAESPVATFPHSSYGISGKSSCSTASRSDATLSSSTNCTSHAGCASRRGATGDDNESELFDSASTMGILDPPARYQTGKDNTSLKPEKLRALDPAPSTFSRVGSWLGLGSKLLNLFRKGGSREDSAPSGPWRIPSGARPKSGAEDGTKGTLSGFYTKAGIPGIKDAAKETLSEPRLHRSAEGLKTERTEGSVKKTPSGAWRIPSGARPRTFESLSPEELKDIEKAKRRMDMAAKRAEDEGRCCASASAAGEAIPGNFPASLCSAL